MTSWMKERDRLVEQTLAFVKGVAAQRPMQAPTIETLVTPPTQTFAISPIVPDPARVEANAPASPVILVQTSQHCHEPVLAAEPIAMVDEPLPPRVAITPPVYQPSIRQPVKAALPERDVITQRVARFRAGQQKLLQDREDNYATAQAKIRASLKNDLTGNDPIA